MIFKYFFITRSVNCSSMKLFKIRFATKIKKLSQPCLIKKKESVYNMQNEDESKDFKEKKQ